jgi:uncharacterized membrane protein YkvA (DUF1232 family)
MIDAWKTRTRQLKAEVYALYLAYRDPRVPWYARFLVAAIIAYALSPVDLIPDFIPVLGYLDDLILLPLAVTLALKLIPVAVMAECRQQAQLTIGQDQVAGQIAGVVIALLWLALLAFTAIGLLKWVVG